MSDDYIGETDLSFMDYDVSGAIEPKTLANGTEHEFQIVDIDLKAAAKSSMIGVILKALNQPEPTKLVRHALWYPKPSDDAEQRNNSALALKRFYKAFNIQPHEQNSASYQSWINRTTWATVSEKEDPKFGMQNRIDRFIGPR